MRIIKDVNSEFERDTVVTIGTFDGVHIGHQKIIKRLVKSAKSNDQASAVLTFFPHPRMVLNSDSDIKLLNTIDEKSALLEGLGVDHLVVQPFSLEFSRMPAMEFVRDILVNRLKAKKVIIGYDHRFGRNRAANIDDLREFGELYGFKVKEISAQEVDEVAVSSTKIRKALFNGDLETANSYLGYSYMLSGLVVEGDKMGKPMGFPTANIKIDETYKLIPKNGVYVVRSILDGNWVFGMMNIGFKPTFKDGDEQYIEVNFFDFEKDIYGEQIQVEVLHRLRDEQKFHSIEELQSQLNSDRKNAMTFIKNFGND